MKLLAVRGRVHKKLAASLIFAVLAMLAASSLILNAMQNSAEDGKDYIILGRGSFNTSAVGVIFLCDTYLEPLDELVVNPLDLDRDAVSAIAFNEPFCLSLDSNISYVGSENNGAFIVTAGDGQDKTSLIISQNGYIAYTAPELTLGTHMPPNVPPREEARTIAEEFLEKLKESNSFFPGDGQKLMFTMVSASYSIVSSPWWEHKWTNYWEVLYAIEYNDVTIAGHAGAKVCVGHNGNVVAFYGDWLNLTPSGKKVVAAVTPNEAISDQGRILMGVLQGVRGNVIKLEVQNVRLVYYVDSIREETGTLQVAYEFTGSCFDADGQQGFFTIYANATN